MISEKKEKEKCLGHDKWTKGTKLSTAFLLLKLRKTNPHNHLSPVISEHFEPSAVGWQRRNSYKNYAYKSSVLEL